MSSISIVLLQNTYYSETLPTTVLTLCRSFHEEALQAYVSEGLAQEPYAVATSWTRTCDDPVAGDEHTNTPPHADNDKYAQVLYTIQH